MLICDIFVFRSYRLVCMFFIGAVLGVQSCSDKEKDDWYKEELLVQVQEPKGDLITT